MSMSTLAGSGRAAAGRNPWRRRAMTRGKEMVAALAHELRARRGARDLARLDDRMLRDIGLQRCGLEVAARCGRPVAGDAD